MDGPVSPSKRMLDPLSDQELFLQKLNLIAVRRVKVKYSRTIKERLRATTKEESLSLPPTHAVRAKLVSGSNRRKPDESEAIGSPPNAQQILTIEDSPGPSGINFQGGVNVLQSIKQRRKKIKNVTPPSTKSLLSYLQPKLEEFSDEDCSSVDEDNHLIDHDPDDPAVLTDPDEYDPVVHTEPFRLREVSISMSRVRWNQGDLISTTRSTRSPSGSPSRSSSATPATGRPPSYQNTLDSSLATRPSSSASQPEMSGWARIDADHYDRNEQLKNLISDLEAEILEREMECSKRKLSLAETKRTVSSAALVSATSATIASAASTSTVSAARADTALVSAAFASTGSSATAESALDFRERILKDFSLRPDLDISEESDTRIDLEQDFQIQPDQDHQTTEQPEQIILESEISRDGNNALELVGSALNPPTNMNSKNDKPSDDLSDTPQAEALGDTPLAELIDSDSLLVRSKDSLPVLANISHDSVFSTLTESSIKSEIKEEPFMDYETEPAEQEYEELPNARYKAEVKPEYLPSYSIIPTQEEDDFTQVGVDESPAFHISSLSAISPMFTPMGTNPSYTPSPIFTPMGTIPSYTPMGATTSNTAQAVTSEENMTDKSRDNSNPRNYLKEQQAGASGSSGLSAGGSGSSGRPTIPSRSFGLPSEASSRSGLPAEASRSSELPEISVEQLSSSEKKADYSSDDEIRTYTSKTKKKKGTVSFIQKQMELLNNIKNKSQQIPSEKSNYSFPSGFRPKRKLNSNKNKESSKNPKKSSITPPTNISEEIFPISDSDDDNIQHQQDQESLEQRNETPKDSINEDRNKLAANKEFRNESSATNNESEEMELPGSEPAGIRSQRRRSTEVIKLINSTGGWKIYQQVDLRISRKVVAPIKEKQGSSLTPEGDSEDISQQLEEKMDRFQDIDKDDRELWEILKEKVEPERRRRGDPFYFIPFTSGDARLDPMVNRIRHELLIAKRRMHNAAEGKSIDFNPSIKGKTLPPSIIKYTYWTPKVDELNILPQAYENRFLAADQISKSTRKSKKFSRLSPPSLADILQARRIAGIDQESWFNYDSEERKTEDSSAKSSSMTTHKTSLSFRKGECHLRRRSDSGNTPSINNPSNIVSKIKKAFKKKRKGILKRQLGKQPKEIEKRAVNTHGANQDYIDIDNIESLVDNEPVEDSSSVSSLESVFDESIQQYTPSCRICDTRFTDQQSLDVHELSCKPYTCKFCRKRFRQFYACHHHELSHQKSGSSSSDTSSSSQADPRRIGVQAAGTLVPGIRRASSAAKTTNPLMLVKPQNDLEITCVECGAIFDTESEFMNHRLTVHPKLRTTTSKQSGMVSPRKLKIKPYKCSMETCDKSFMNKDNLEQHKSRHFQPHPWKCRQCNARYRTEKSLKKHIADVHEMQKELRAQYRMVNVSKKMENEEYDFENMVEFDMEGLSSLYKVQKDGNGEGSAKLSDNVQQELQAANEGLMIEVELVDPAQSMDQLINLGDSGETMDQLINLGDINNLVTAVNNTHLVHQNLEHLVQHPQSMTTAPVEAADTSCATSGQMNLQSSSSILNIDSSLSEMEGGAENQIINNQMQESSSSIDLAACNSSQQPFTAATLSYQSPILGSPNSSQQLVHEASTDTFKQLDKRELSPSVSSELKSISGGKPGTDLLLKTPRQHGLEGSPGGTLSKLGGYVLTSTPDLDELLDSPAQRTLKKSEEEGNESMDEDIEKIQHFLGQGQGGLLDQEGRTDLESLQDKRGPHNQGGPQDEPSFANDLAIKKLNKAASKKCESSTLKKTENINTEEKDEDICDIINFIETSDTKALAQEEDKTTEGPVEEDILYLETLPDSSNHILELVTTSSDKPEKTEAAPDLKQPQKFKIPKSPLKRGHNSTKDNSEAAAMSAAKKAKKISFEEQLKCADESLDLAAKPKKPLNSLTMKRKKSESGIMSSRKQAKLIPLPLGKERKGKSLHKKTSTKLSTKVSTEKLQSNQNLNSSEEKKLESKLVNRQENNLKSETKISSIDAKKSSLSKKSVSFNVSTRDPSDVRHFNSENRSKHSLNQSNEIKKSQNNEESKSKSGETVNKNLSVNKSTICDKSVKLDIEKTKSVQPSSELRIRKKIEVGSYKGKGLTHPGGKDKPRSPEIKPKRKLDLSTYKKVRKVALKSSTDAPTNTNASNITTSTNTTTGSKPNTDQKTKKKILSKEIDLDEIIRQPSKLGVGRLKQQQTEPSNLSVDLPSTETLKHVLSSLGKSSAKRASEEKDASGVRGMEVRSSSEEKPSTATSEERPRDPRMHRSKQFEKQTKEIFDMVKPILEKAKKAKTVASTKAASKAAKSVGSVPAAVVDADKTASNKNAVGDDPVLASTSSSAPGDKTRSRGMGLPAPVPASNLSSEDESPAHSTNTRQVNPTAEESPTIVLTSKQGYFTVQNKNLHESTKQGAHSQSIPAVTRGSSAPAESPTMLTVCATTVLSNMLPVNIPTYSSPVITSQTHVSSGNIVPPAGIVPLQRSNKNQNIHKMGQTFTKSGTGDALISIQCITQPSSTAPASGAPPPTAATTTTPPGSSPASYGSTVPSATSYISTTSVSISSSQQQSGAPQQPNPDSQPVISSRPGGFGRPSGTVESRFPGGGSLTRKLSLPVPVSGINQLARQQILPPPKTALSSGHSSGHIAASQHSSTAFFQTKSNSSVASRPKLSLPKPVPAAIASPVKPAQTQKQ